MEYVKGYELLANILTDAYEQSAKGKGRERHGLGDPWHDQPILTLGREFGIGGTNFQAAKKMREAQKMAERGEYAAAEREILGTIVYAAASIALIRELAEKRAKNVDGPALVETIEKSREYGAEWFGDRAGKTTHGVTQAVYDASRGIASETIPAAPPEALTPEPIPDDAFWDNYIGLFRYKNALCRDSIFYERWQKRRDEFPVWKEPVPKAIFWHESLASFVDAQGMLKTESFSDRWRQRFVEFPKWPILRT